MSTDWTTITPPTPIWTPGSAPNTSWSPRTGPSTDWATGSTTPVSWSNQRLMNDISATMNDPFAKMNGT